MPQLVTSPTQSSRPFIAPSTTVRRTPSISDITTDLFASKPVEPTTNTQSTSTKPAENQVVAAALVAESKSGVEISPESADVQTPKTQPEPDKMPMESAEIVASEPEPITPVVPENVDSESSSDFEAKWHEMFEKVFVNIPSIYFPYREYTPELKDNIIYFKVNNEIQKENIEIQKRDILEFLRNHFDHAIEDLVIISDQTFIPKKIIYDQKDKFENFAEENPNFVDFVKILNLHMS